MGSRGGRWGQKEMIGGKACEGREGRVASIVMDGKGRRPAWTVLYS